MPRNDQPTDQILEPRIFSMFRDTLRTHCVGMSGGSPASAQRVLSLALTHQTKITVIMAVS